MTLENFHPLIAQVFKNEKIGYVDHKPANGRMLFLVVILNTNALTEIARLCKKHKIQVRVECMKTLLLTFKKQ